MNSQTTSRYATWAAAVLSALTAFLLPSAANAAVLWSTALGVYDFNDTSGAGLSDSSGPPYSNGVGMKTGASPSAQAAVYNNAIGTSTLPGWDGWALALNGGSEGGRYVDLGQGAGDEYQITGALTLFIRVNLNNVTSSRGLLSKDGPSGSRAFSLTLTGSNTIQFRINGVATVSYTSATEIVTDTWFDIAAVYSPGNKIELFLNGQSVASTTTGIPLSIINAASTPLLIGATPQAGAVNGLNGLVEKVAIWDTALTGEQIRDLSVIPEPGTTALFGAAVLSLAAVRLRKSGARRFRGGIMAAAASLLLPVHHGMTTEFRYDLTTQAGEKDGKAISFYPEPQNAAAGDSGGYRLDGHSYGVLSESVSREVIANGSFTLYARARLKPHRGTLISKRGAPGDRTFDLQLAGEKDELRLVFTVSETKSADRKVTLEVPFDTWIQIVAVCSPGESLKLYCKEKEIQQGNSERSPSSVAQSEVPIFIGAQPFPDAQMPNNFLQGEIAEIRCWNEALTEDHITRVLAEPSER